MNALNSPLLRLPAELRNAIFTYVFSDNVYLFNDASIWPKVATHVGASYWNKTISMTSFDENNLGVIVTSRQLYAETALLPYQLALFHFRFTVSKGAWSLCVERFVKNRSRAQELLMNKNMTVSQFGKSAGDIRYYHGTSAWDHSYPFSRE